MLKKTPKPKKNRKDYVLAYDWGRGKRNPDLVLNGVGSEMVLSPVKVFDGVPEKKSKFTKAEWTSKQVMIHWMWPGETIRTLLSLLAAGKLTGEALLSVSALAEIKSGRKVKVETKETIWAKEIISQEQQLSERCFQREKAAKRALAKSRTANRSPTGRK